ncbi:MAG: WecB/TagA/CpsF family glycosyltransferase [Planctomycetota bacterium]|nr:WecB/TagA/CpsF family glycosyltransferase [Planctomycetota bacterium]
MDFLVGERRRAPEWMQQTGMEWLFRYLNAPRRLVDRYARAACLFPLLAWREWRGGRLPTN